MAKEKKTTKEVKKPQIVLKSGSSLPDNKPKVELLKTVTVLEFTGKPDGVCHVLVKMRGIYSDFKVGQVFEIK